MVTSIYRLLVSSAKIVIIRTVNKYFLCFYNEYRKEPRKEKFGEYWIDKSIKESSLFCSYYLSLEDAIKRAEKHAGTDYRNWKETYKNNIPIIKR